MLAVESVVGWRRIAPHTKWPMSWPIAPEGPSEILVLLSLPQWLVFGDVMDSGRGLSRQHARCLTGFVGIDIAIDEFESLVS